MPVCSVPVLVPVRRSVSSTSPAVPVAVYRVLPQMAAAVRGLDATMPEPEGASKSTTISFPSTSGRPADTAPLAKAAYRPKVSTICPVPCPVFTRATRSVAPRATSSAVVVPDVVEAIS